MKCTAILALVVTLVQAVVVNQPNAPWGLARISSTQKLTGDPRALTWNYRYEDRGGAGVDVYVLGTGVMTQHIEFQGRARWGATFGGYGNADGHGSGTHAAGTIGGNRFGVAKRVTIIAVKVLGDDGQGRIGDIIAGLNWVGNAARNSGRPSVAYTTYRGAPVQALDDAVNSLSRQGVHVIVPAGDQNTDARSISPARATDVCAVATSGINDAKGPNSNIGPAVCIFAPGVDVISAWIGPNNAANILSGTPSAAAHVAGVVAQLIALRGNTSPQSMKQFLQSSAQRGVLINIPAGTINSLVRSS